MTSTCPTPYLLHLGPAGGWETLAEPPARPGLLAGSPRAEPNERDDLEGPLTRADLKRRRFRVRTERD